MVEAPVAFVFPGQGSQAVGMGSAMAAAFPPARAVFEAMDAALGENLTRLLREGPIEELTLTRNAQPALLATSIAILRAVEAQTTVRPAYVAGHSLGEYSALVAAGALELGDAVRLTRRRGDLMQSAVPAGTGAMAAIMGVDRAALEAVCADAAQGEVVSPANFNAPGQIVIAGHQAAVERASAAVSAAGGKAIPLKVSAPFHSALMRPAAEGLRAALETIHIEAPRVPVVANVTAEPVTDPAQIKDLLVRQLDGPVRWSECVERLASLGVKTVVEIGPGKVLQGLVKRIDKSLRVLGIEGPDDLGKLAGGIS
jgi:[acyl-carrier-protein] S-malonyltransferase